MARKQLNTKQENNAQIDAEATAETINVESLSIPQTEAESAVCEEGAHVEVSSAVSQTETELAEIGAECDTEADFDGNIPQTETGSAENEAEHSVGEDPDATVSRTGSVSTSLSDRVGANRRSPKAEASQIDKSGKDTHTESEDTKAMPDGAPKKSQSPRRKAGVLTIDGERTVETEADKARNDLIDLTESLKTGRILSGTIQGVERPNGRGSAFAVIYHGSFKVIVPAEEAVELPEDLRDQEPEDVLHYLLTKRLGAEVDYIVKGIDANSGIAVASRLDAMRIKRREYYFGSDRDGNNLIYPGLCAEARVVSVIRAGIFVDLFGLEVYIPLRELSYQRIMDAAGYFQPGQRILVKVTGVERINKNQVKASASVKQAAENPYEKALRMYAEGNRYVGTVSMVDTNGVFVALDGGIDCLCSYPKRGRPPRGARVTVRILGINHESNRIWGAITHIAVPR